MRRDATARKCFVQLVGNRKLAGNKALERPSLPASEPMSFQNYIGLRGRARTGCPYPAFHGMRKSSTCGFVFADCGMLEGCRPSPVNRHSFEFAGWAGARSAPITVPAPAPAGWPLSGWRPALRKRKTRNSRCPEGAGEVVGVNTPAGGKGFAGHRGPFPRLYPRPGRPSARRRRKFSQNCPCIAVPVPV